MKKLIITAGLPGVGKSYILRILKKKLRRCLYFDSDLFSKKYIVKHKIDFVNLPKNKQNKERLRFHKAKLEEIKKNFKKYDIIMLDTCFDLPKSRKMFYDLEKNKKIKLMILEVICPENVVKKRIFGNRHETDRMVGTKQTRWKIYKRLKKNWKLIRKKHFVIHSDKNIKPQINSFLKELK